MAALCQAQRQVLRRVRKHTLPLMTSWSSAVIVKLCLVKHANSQRHVGDCDLVAEVGIGSSSNSSVGGCGTSVDHFEKQGNTWVTHTKSLQCRPGNATGDKQGVCWRPQGGPEWWLLIPSELGSVERGHQGTSGRSHFLHSCRISWHPPALQLRNWSQDRRSYTEQGLTSPGSLSLFPISRSLPAKREFYFQLI